MSASLVGSEMCIRDRPSLLAARCWCGTSRASACAKPQAWWEPAATARTVSYTHLTLPTICSV
eukprot:6216523-Alexandrium_andersonii.AAC.1